MGINNKGNGNDEEWEDQNEEKIRNERGDQMIEREE